MSEGERELLREALAESHRETRRRTPPFSALWARAAARAGPPGAAARRRGLTVAAVAAAALVVVATIALWNAGRQRRELEQAMTVASAVSEWRAPLDFLLETPGQEWLEATPTWDPRPGDGRWGLDPELLGLDSPGPDSPQEIQQ